MDLFDEDLIQNKQTDHKRSTTIILAVIIFLLVMVCILIGVIVYLKQTTLNVELNGRVNNSIKNMIIIEDDQVYVPIRKVAEHLGYEAKKR